MKEKYNKRKFSVLGDSISTLDGYSVPGDAAFYEGENRLIANVFLPEDTWWGRVIDALGGQLLVNNSISGSMVTRHRDCMTASYSSSDERTSSLGVDGCKPDVIMIFMGTNDWGWGVKPKPENDSESNDISIFSVAYLSMLNKLRANYPESEIWCCTLPVSTCKRREGFAFPYRYGTRHIDEYCEVIRDCAQKTGSRLIDLYRFGTPYDTIDGFHPNSDGMITLAEAVLSVCD